MKTRVVIRTDGGTHIGMGHVVRCMAVGEMLRDDFDIHFIIQETNKAIFDLLRTNNFSFSCIERTDDFQKDVVNFLNHLQENDIVLIDGYHFKTDYQIAIKNKNHTLVCIDDLYAWNHVADVIINHTDVVNVEDYDAEPYTQFFLGLDYALLRAPFLSKENRTRTIQKVERGFISMGAADANNLTLLFAQSLLATSEMREVHLMVSDINPHIEVIKDFAAQNEKITLHDNLNANKLAQLLTQSDLVVCPASSISLEACAIGVPLATGFTADNQKGNLKGLISHNAAFNLGDFNLMTIESATTALQNICDNVGTMNQQIKNQSMMIDGKSGGRIRSVFKNLRG